MKLNLNTEFNFDDSIFIAPGAVLLGDIKLGKNVNIWFNAVIRADLSTITIGDNTNIQDGVIIHCDTEHSVKIGNNVTIGHGAIIHGAYIEDNILIGMGATILNGAKIGKNVIIGAGALISENTEIPPNSITYGVPAKIIKPITDKGIELIKESAIHYVQAAKEYIIKFNKKTVDGILV